MFKIRAASVRTTVCVVAFLAAPAWADEPIAVTGEPVMSFKAPEARQAVAVDDAFFYAIDNRTIAKYDKRTGERVASWAGPDGAPIIHLNSGVVIDGKLYAAHSNYPGWPMVSSVEIWDAAALKHIDTHSFGIDRGSLTWLDHHGGAWWGAFANYGAGGEPGFGNDNTQIVRFDAGWQVAEAWVLPEALLEELDPMSNSGGSWGPDGRLWITGHDKPAAYALALPEAGSVLRWIATAALDIGGQGIAWDRSGSRLIWGIVRDKATGERSVTAARVPLP